MTGHLSGYPFSGVFFLWLALALLIGAINAQRLARRYRREAAEDLAAARKILLLVKQHTTHEGIIAGVNRLLERFR